MSALVVAALGVLGGLGLMLAVLGWSAQRPDLATALGQGTVARFVASTGPELEGLRPLQRLQIVLEYRLAKTRLTTPDTDLRVVGQTRGAFLLQRVAWAFGGLIIGPIYIVIFAMFGWGVPYGVPAGLGLLLAALGWFVPGMIVTRQAEDRRQEMRYALVAFMTIASLHRAAGAGMQSALEDAAATSSTWTFRRIAARIDSSKRGEESAWAGLTRLAEELGIPEVAEMSATAGIAGEEGAAVGGTLLAQARSLRNRLSTAGAAEAEKASTRMNISKAVLAFVLIAFLLYPALSSF